jgi:hypothetical protein
VSGYRPEPEELEVLNWLLGGCVIEEYVQVEGFTAPLRFFKLRSPNGVRKHLSAGIQSRLLHNNLIEADTGPRPERVVSQYRLTSFGEDVFLITEALQS